MKTTKNTRQKKRASWIILLAIMTGLSIVWASKGYYLLRASQPGPEAFNIPLGSNSEWETYSDKNLFFSYPKILTLKKDDAPNTTTYSLTHTDPYSHSDTCMMKGDKEDLVNDFKDFDVSIQLWDGDLKNALPDYTDNFVTPGKNELILEPGFIDTYNTKTLKGYRMTASSEYCGSFIYFFPLSEDKTLVVENRFAPDMYPATEIEDPLGILKDHPNIFSEIFSSIRVKTT